MLSAAELRLVWFMAVSDARQLMISYRLVSNLKPQPIVRASLTAFIPKQLSVSHENILRNFQSILKGIY